MGKHEAEREASVLTVTEVLFKATGAMLGVGAALGVGAFLVLWVAVEILERR